MLRRVLEKLKPIGMLLLMIFLCLLISLVVSLFEKDSKENIYLVSNINKVNTDSESVIDTFEVEDVGEIEELEQATVLAAQSTSVDSCGDIMKIESESICYRPSSGDLDYVENGQRSGTLVKKDAKIELISATVPLELFSGMEVADSNRKITTETPTFKAAGEQIDDIVANTQFAPDEQIDTYRPWVEDEPFKTEYSLGKNESETSQTGEVGVTEKIVNKCERCNNKSNVNPQGSNYASSYLLDTLRAPGEKEEITSSSIVQSCGGEDRFEDWDSTRYKTCQKSLPAIFLSFLKTIGDTKWNDCINDQDSCMYAEDVVLKMVSPFGSDRECDENGVCTNAYMRRRNNLGQIPNDISSGKFYYLTPCEAMIGGQRFTINCAWDMSHLYLEREGSEFDDLPEVESTPTEDEYNQFLLNEIKDKRGASIPL